MVSIVTICWNMSRELWLTAQSVLAQKDIEIEYIIVDKESTDGTARTILDIQCACESRNIPLRWSSEADKGIYDAMNKGVRHASGEWIVFMNAGDRFAHEEALSQLVNPEMARQTDLLYGSTILERDFGTVLVRPRPLSYLQRKMAFCHQAMAVRTALLREHPFDLRFPVCADFEFVHWCYTSGKRLREMDTTVAIFDGTKGNSRQHRLKLDRECALITGRYATLEWKLKHALKVVEVAFNTLVRSVMPRRLTNAMRRRIYRNKTKS